MKRFFVVVVAELVCSMEMIIGFVFDSFLISSYPINFCLLCLWKAAKEIWTEGKNRGYL